MENIQKENILPEYQKKITVQEYSAQSVIDGVQIIESKVFSDDGGFFLELSRLQKERFAEFPDFEIKQINYSEMEPGVIKATHLHFQQEDIWFVPPSDKLLIGLIDCREQSPTKGMTMRFVMGGGRARLLYIPRGVGHGAANLWNNSSAIIYFVNNQFDPAPESTDERRLPWDIFGEGFWEIQKG